MSHFFSAATATAAVLACQMSLIAADRLDSPRINPVAFYDMNLSEETGVPTVADDLAGTNTPSAAEPVPAQVEKEWTGFSGPISDSSSTAPASPPSDPCKDKKKQEELKKKVAASHKNLFYSNDFSYLLDPCYDGYELGDALKRNCLGDYITYDLGGQYRTRYHHEQNFRGLGLTGRDDDFLLHRTRLYSNVEVGKRVRFFGEYIDAQSNYENFAPRGIEENRSDLLNLFLDVNVFEQNGNKLVARGGRQEIALGDQRYVSPLDWGNTRRTFDGGRLMYSNKDWNIDGFWLAPLTTDIRNFDRANENQALYGVYSTYKGFGTDVLDLYWIAFDDDVAGFGYDSLGARYYGSYESWLVDTEAAYQFGENADGSSHDAGFYTIGLGRKFEKSPGKSTLFGYIDWASGSDELGAGNGHHHFQPLVHKYNGFMDLYGRRNLIDANLQLTTTMSPKLKSLLWFHAFWLENINDSPYNATMSPFAPGVIPVDDHLGNELDLLLTYSINPRQELQLGYSHFWAGAYYDSPGLPANIDADFFYTQYLVNF